MNMADNFKTWDSISPRTLQPGIEARLVHTEQMSVAMVELAKGAILPEHFHVHEQVSTILEGRVEFTVAGETRLCQPGDIVVLPSNVPHGVVALEPSRVLDVFSPVRSDYK